MLQKQQQKNKNSMMNRSKYIKKEGQIFIFCMKMKWFMFHTGIYLSIHLKGLLEYKLEIWGSQLVKLVHS